MSRCKANPCCSDPYFCEIPLPQHKSGLAHLNEKRKDWDHRTSKDAKSPFKLYPWEYKD